MLTLITPTPALDLCRPLLLLLLLWSMQGVSQDRPTHKERAAARREVRNAMRHDPQRWDRMPAWGVGLGYAEGYSALGSLDDQLAETGFDRRGAVRGEVTRRLHEGWFVQAGLEYNSARFVGMNNMVLLSTRTVGWPFPTTYEEFETDIITARHDVFGLDLMTGRFSAPFPRRKAVGFTVSAAGGLGVYAVRAEHGVAHRQRYSVSHNFMDVLFDFGLADAKEIDEWYGRPVFDTQMAIGVSVRVDLRTELWLGRHVSLLVPSISFGIPVVKPYFEAANDSEGEVLKAYRLDLTSVRMGTGLVIRF